jgi:hypothetical protein
MGYPFRRLQRLYNQIEWSRRDEAFESPRMKGSAANEQDFSVNWANRKIL